MNLIVGGEVLKSKIEEFGELVEQSHNIVFFGGAGVSTESGIPDFRSVDGLYNQRYKYPPETILSHDFFMRKTAEFYEFYREKMLCLEAQPNKAHEKLAQLEACGRLKAVITQNIDSLHQKAGSENVLELHGSVHRNYCMKCSKFYTAEFIKNTVDIPRCECGGIIKPDVVLYQEALDDETVKKSIEYISKAEVLIIGGTSLGVYPAAGLIDYYKGNKLILINRDSTPRDDKARIVINDKIGEVFEKLTTG